MKLSAAIVLMLMLVVATECTRLSFELPDTEAAEVVVSSEVENSEMEPREVADGNTCSALSTRFPGRCTVDRACSLICKTEGFTSGQCFRLLCLCTKPCVFDSLVI